MITSLDLQRITKLLLENSMMGKLAALEDKLQKLPVIESQNTPDDLITMNSEITYYDHMQMEAVKLRLVYQLSPLYGNQTSIMSPLGTCLLGMKPHEEAIFETRDGGRRKISVSSISYQPESQGDFHL